MVVGKRVVSVLDGCVKEIIEGVDMISANTTFNKPFLRRVEHILTGWGDGGGYGGGKNSVAGVCDADGTNILWEECTRFRKKVETGEIEA